MKENRIPKDKVRLGDLNLVELIADPDDCAFDQPCIHGFRVEGHSVYCHNENWPEAPRKCHRTWYTGGEVKDEDCPGFEKNDLSTKPLNIEDFLEIK